MLSTSAEATLASTTTDRVGDTRLATPERAFPDDLGIRWADDEPAVNSQRLALMSEDEPVPTARGRRSTLVGVDGTEASAAALRWAVGQADRCGKVVTATAWKYPFWAAARPEPGAPIARPEADFVLHAWHRAAATLRLAGVTEREHVVVESDAGPMLVSESVGADLLVVGWGGRAQTASTLLGTVSGYCVANSHVPVAVVPAQASSRVCRRVVVGIDQSAEAASALRWAVQHLRGDVMIDVVHVVADPATGKLETSALWLDRTVAEARGIGGDHRRPVLSGRIEVGDPAVVLRDAAAVADVLVLGARGRGGLAHALVGSVTTTLCHQPDVVTIVVPARRT